MEYRSRSLIPGLALIIVGILILLANLGTFNLLKFWPLLVIAVGLVFLVQGFRDRENYGLFMPAMVLIISGCLFGWCELDGWWNMSDLWPLFIGAPGLGFILMYLFGERDGGLLIPGSILLMLCIIFLGLNPRISRWWPAILVFVGLILLIWPPERKPGKQAETEGTSEEPQQ
jgi:hypothetical protein